MCKTLIPSENKAASSKRRPKSRGFPDTLRRTSAYTGRVMRHVDGGFIAFIDEVPGLSARGSTPDEAEWNLRLPFSEYVATARSEGRLCEEIRVLWME
jgi:predicted RNase H-like HicB family nuclease